MTTLAQELGFHIDSVGDDELVISRRGERFTDIVDVFQALEWLRGPGQEAAE